MHSKSSREVKTASQPAIIHDRLNLSAIPNLPSAVVKAFADRGITILIQLRNRRSLISIVVEQALRTTPNHAQQVSQRLLELTGRARSPLTTAKPPQAELTA